MKVKVFLSGCGIMFACVAFGRSWESGNFTVALSDVYGNPITNATVTVKSGKDVLWGRGCDDEYNFTSAKSDEKGEASVDFKFCESHFVWRLETPSHYSQRYSTPREFFKRKVVESDYRHIDTNTVDGLTKWRELKRLQDEGTEESIAEYLKKFEPKSVEYADKSIRRSLRFYPKKNPQPMYAYAASDWPDIPLTKTSVKMEGYTMDVYPIVDFDLERAEAHVSGGTNFGSRVDFRFERYYVETNGVANFYGRMVFAPGCGAYRRKQTGDASFPSCYAADTNAVFETQIDFYSIYDVKTGKTIKSKRLLGEDEFLVLRTRILVGENGVTNGWHYSKLLGRGRVNGNLYFKQSVFNPRLNDPNLEFDMKRNLASPKSEVMWP